MVNNLLPDSEAAAKQAGIADIGVLEATDYYKTPRGQHPNAPGFATARSLTQIITYDAYNNG